MERIAVSGSSGFIGRHLVSHLERQGHLVERVGRNGYLPVSDLIFDLAAYGNMYGQEGYQKIYEANLMRVLEAIRCAERTDYKAFVFTSTSAVQLPYQTYYSASKKAMEDMVAIYAKETDKPVVVVRPFSVYGPGEAAHRFIPTIIRCAESQEELTLAPGVHDWIYIDDLVEGMWLVSQHADRLKGQVVNIGTGVQTTNEEVLQTAMEVMDKDVRIKRVNRLREFDTDEWVADIGTIRSLGWSPQVDLREGIRRTYERTKTKGS